MLDLALDIAQEVDEDRIRVILNSLSTDGSQAES
jgi:hypothetical protein